MDPSYQRPIEARYVDPYELIWLSTARRLGLRIRRDPAVFSMTDGAGLLALGPRGDPDPDDTLAQQVLHEICHWVVAGPDAVHRRDWGYELEVPLDDPREHACLRLQATLADRVGLRRLLAPTGLYRPYWEALPPDPATPLDDGPHEARVQDLYRAALSRVDGPPWGPALDAALQATAQVHETLAPFLEHYATEIPEDPLPSLWAADLPAGAGRPDPAAGSEPSEP